MNEKMIWTVAETVTLIIESYLLTYYVTHFLKYKSEEKSCSDFLLFFFTTVGSNLILRRLEFINVVLEIIQITFILLFAIVCLRDTLIKKVFVSFSSVLIILLIKSVILSLSEFIFNDSMHFICTSTGIFRMFLLLVTEFIYFLIIRLLIKMNQKSYFKNNVDNSFANDSADKPKSIYSNNPALNDLIHSKLYELKKNNISVNLNITGSVELFPENDIITILSVVLDNTNEFCRFSDAVYEINFKISDSDDFLSMMVNFDSSENLCDDEIMKFLMNISENQDIKNLIEKYDGAVVSNNNACPISFSIWLGIEKAVYYLKNSCLTADAR